MTSATLDTTAAALEAAARGWHVFPLTPYRKKPVRGFTDWEMHATTNPDTIAAFWPRQPYNIGIACGPSGLVVIDLDQPKPGEHPPDDLAARGIATGEHHFRLLCAERGEPYPEDTFTVRTRRGGLHLYFTAPETVRLRNSAGARGGLGWLIDTRAWGGQVVGPGSYVHQSDGAGPYAITRDAPPAPLPAWIGEALKPAPPPPTSAPDLLASLTGIRLSRYGEAALRAEAEQVATASGGDRNAALNRAAFNLGQLVARHVLTEQVVIPTLTRAAELANQRVTDRKPASLRKIAAVIASGLSAGMKAEPRRRKAA